MAEWGAYFRNEDEELEQEEGDEGGGSFGCWIINTEPVIEIKVKLNCDGFQGKHNIIVFSFNFWVDYKNTGRDSLVFLVDASKEMFIKGEDGEPSNFDMTLQVYATCVWCISFSPYLWYSSQRHDIFYLLWFAVYMHVCVCFMLCCLTSMFVCF